MSASSRKWYSGKSLQDSKVFEDFPALSATFANSYKSEEKHYDDDFPRGGKVPHMSYSDKLQKNTKTLRYFNQNIDVTECFSSNDEGAEGPQVNGTRQNTSHYFRAVNENFSLVSRSYTNCGVNQIAKSKNYDMKNVLKCNSGNHVRNSVIKQFNENKAVSSKWCADRDIGQTKSKCVQSGSQNVSVRETKSGLRIFDSEKQIIQKSHCNLENDCGNNSITNKTRSVQQNHGNKKLHWKTEVPTAVECRSVSPKDQNRNHWDEMCNFNNKVQEQQQQSANKHFCTQHSVNNNPKKQQSVNFPLNKQQQSVNYPLNKQQQCTNSYLSSQRTKPRDHEPYKNSHNKTASNSSEIYHDSVDSSSSKNNIKDVSNVKNKATRFSAKPDQEPEAYKKKKKRLSKIKRQTAFQTGKVLLLSPEFHSRIVKNLTDSETVGSSKNDTININSLNEYPSLVAPADTDQVKNSCNESHAWGHLTQKSSGTSTEHQPSLTEPKHDEMPDRTTYHTLMRSGNSPLEKEVPQPVLPPNGEERKDDGWQSDGSWEKVHRKTKECPREPIQLFDILAISKPKEKSKKKVEIIPKSDLEKPIKVKGPSNAPNVLDSSAPVKRGKEREHPKQKKVTPLKKIILSERLKKRGLGISNTETTTSEDCSKQHENSKPLESNDGIEETKILSCIAEENETAKVEGTCSKLDFPNSSEVSEQGSRESAVDPYSMDIELIADTAEAIVDQILELAVAKVRTMGLNVNAACFEIPDSPEKLELASPDSSIDENPLKCEESSQHLQDTVEHIIFPEIQDCSEINKETNEQNKYESDAIEVVDFHGDADITSNKDEGCEDDVPSKWDESQRQDAVQTVIHHRNFREYCTHLLSKELNEAVLLLIDNLARFQDRQHQKDPVKARMKRRLIYGIKEVKKYLKLKKLRCIIIAPDLENIEAEGGLNAELAHIIKTTKEYHIPCIFASDRKHLGRVCHKPVPVSCLGIFSYEGSEAAYRKIMELHAANTKDYEVLTKVVGSHMTDEDIEEVLKMKEILEVKEKRQTVSLIQSKILTSVLTRHVPDAVQWFSSTYQLKLA